MADVTIGNATPAGYSLGSIGTNEMYMSQFTLAGADTGAIVKKLRARVRQTGAGTSTFRAYVYKTDGTLMAWTEFVLAAITADSIVEATFTSGSTMANGTYWLGVHQGVTGSGFGFGFITSGFTNGREKSSTYASGIPSPLGASNAQTDLATAVEAVVGAVAAAPTFVPQTIIIG